MRRWITTGLGLAALLLASGSPSQAQAPAPDTGTPKARPSPGCEEGGSATGPRRASDTVHTIQVDGETRSYRLAVPKNVRARGPVPLVLLIHGFSSNADSFASLTRLPARGAADGFLVATPDGTDGRWQLDAHGSDAAFLDALVDELTSTSCVDLRNVHAAGMSLGSAFGLLYSCARQDEIASFVAVTVEFQLGCSAPMSILAFHGTEDPLVPYQDGKIGASLPGPVRGTELNMADWAELGGCRPEPRNRRIGPEVVRSTWSGCRGSTDVVLYTVEGGGHTWPGADPDRQVTHTTDQVDATAAGLAFFRRHPLR